jgi:hypothetical protein
VLKRKSLKVKIAWAVVAAPFLVFFIWLLSYSPLTVIGTIVGALAGVWAVQTIFESRDS